MIWAVEVVRGDVIVSCELQSQGICLDIVISRSVSNGAYPQVQRCCDALAICSHAVGRDRGRVPFLRHSLVCLVLVSVGTSSSVPYTTAVGTERVAVPGLRQRYSGPMNQNTGVLGST